jgi:hypothetical protein
MGEVLIGGGNEVEIGRGRGEGGRKGKMGAGGVVR